MKNNITIISIILLVIILIGLIVTLILGLTNTSFDFLFSRGEIILNEEYDNKSLTLNSNISDIKIYESDNDKIKIEIKGNKDDEIKIDNQESLIIDYNIKSKFGINLTKYEINIYLPKEYNNKLKINTKVGNIKSDISLDNISVTATTGNIDLEEITNKVDLKLTTGNVTINKLLVNEESKITATTGNVKIINAKINKNTTIELTTGNIKIENINDDIYINANSKTGSRKVINGDRHSDIELNVSTTTGNIIVG